MKKFMLAVVCVALLTGCFPSKTGLSEMEAKDVITAIEDKDTFILLVGKTSCTACDEFQKVIDEIVKNYNIRISEVMLDEEEAVVDETTSEETYPDIDKLEEHIGVVGATPSVYFIKEGEIIGAFTGTVSYDSFKSKIEKYGFLPEE